MDTITENLYPATGRKKGQYRRGQIRECSLQKNELEGSKHNEMTERPVAG